MNKESHYFLGYHSKNLAKTQKSTHNIVIKNPEYLMKAQRKKTKRKSLEMLNSFP